MRNCITKIPMITDNKVLINFVILLSNKLYLSKTEKSKRDIIKTKIANTINNIPILNTFFIFDMC